MPEPEGGSIFERFYRSADQEPEPRGLGLGLWIVKSIVERHGGRVARRAHGGGPHPLHGDAACGREGA